MKIHIRHKAFAETTLISDLTIHTGENEIVALVGPSGAGKSTLLNIIAGLDKDFSGDITFDDQRPPGLMFQEARLMPWLTVQENVTLVAPPDHPDPTGEALSLLTLTGLESQAGKYPSQLSGGMSKRLALARAMMFKPGVLLMDEPFSSLDAPAAESLRQCVLSLKATSPFSIIYVTHDLKEAVAIADRVLILDANPMTLKHQEFITLPRPRYLHDKAVSDVCEPLYRAWPGLLYGNADERKTM